MLFALRLGGIIPFLASSKAALMAASDVKVLDQDQP
jgi:hypothetical protein